MKNEEQITETMDIIEDNIENDEDNVDFLEDEDIDNMEEDIEEMDSIIAEYENEEENGFSFEEEGNYSNEEYSEESFEDNDDEEELSDKNIENEEEDYLDKTHFNDGEDNPKEIISWEDNSKEIDLLNKIDYENFDEDGEEIDMDNPENSNYLSRNSYDPKTKTRLMDLDIPLLSQDELLAILINSYKYTFTDELKEIMRKDYIELLYMIFQSDNDVLKYFFFRYEVVEKIEIANNDEDEPFQLSIFESNLTDYLLQLVRHNTNVPFQKRLDIKEIFDALQESTNLEIEGNLTQLETVEDFLNALVPVEENKKIKIRINPSFILSREEEEKQQIFYFSNIMDIINVSEVEEIIKIGDLENFIKEGNPQSFILENISNERDKSIYSISARDILESYIKYMSKRVKLEILNKLEKDRDSSSRYDTILKLIHIYKYTKFGKLKEILQ